MITRFMIDAGELGTMRLTVDSEDGQHDWRLYVGTQTHETGSEDTLGAAIEALAEAALDNLDSVDAPEAETELDQILEMVQE